MLSKAWAVAFVMVPACKQEPPRIESVRPPPVEAAPAPSRLPPTAGASVLDAGERAVAEVRSRGRRFDVNHVLSTGQSLAVGFKGVPALTTKQPFHNLSFASGVIGDAYGLDKFVPLVEGDVVGGEANSVMYVETMSSGLANLVTALGQVNAPVPEHTMLLSIHGVSGSEYAGLRKGTKAYALGMKQVAAARAIAAKDGRSYAVRAVTVVHGEADHTARSTHYERDQLAWQADYARDVALATGETEPVPMLISQLSGWTALGDATSSIPLAQLAAHVHAEGRVVLVGPKYHLPYADGLHLTNEGYRHLGEDFAKAYVRVVLRGEPWEPVRPRAITRRGTTLTVRFHVPVPPLVLDVVTVKDPGQFGFAYTDESATPPKIAAVAVEGPDQIRIRLDAEPTGTRGRLSYAMRGVPNAGSGPRTGARGNLRDSDPTPSRHGYALYNWCVHFDEAVDAVE